MNLSIESISEWKMGDDLEISYLPDNILFKMTRLYVDEQSYLICEFSQVTGAMCGRLYQSKIQNVKNLSLKIRKNNFH